MSTERPYHIAVDIGGTFTDLVAAGHGVPALEAKSPSTPEDPADGVVDVLGKAAEAIGISVAGLLSRCNLFVLGTTIATNTMLELNGATTGLVCTEGFRDDLPIRRGYIPRTHDFRAPFPPDLIPRRWRLGVRERIDKNGAINTPLHEEDVVAAAATFKRAGVQSVAVCLFNSFLNPVHERQVKEIIGREMPGAYVTVSTDVLPVMGEYPRVSTTAVNAYVGPRTIDWLAALERRLQGAGFDGNLFIMQNNGGIIDTLLARRRPVLAVLSGPAAGAPGASFVSEGAADRNFILFDMGGTSTDITILREDLPLIAEELNINGYDVMTPAVDVHTVAAGGGAVAHVDTGGLLRVGPRSAGAKPGPAALGRGGQEPTVTDANLLLGRLDPKGYAGGEIPLYPELARAALVRIGERLGRSPEAAALGVTRIAEATMAKAIKTFCLYKGVDPREFALVSAGGAGGLHAAAMAETLGVRRVHVPRVAPVFCAMGMLRADLRRDFVHSCFQNLDAATAEGLTAELERLNAMAEEEMAAAPWPTRHRRYEYTFAMQYRGQLFQVDVPAPAALTPDDLPRLRENFHRLHEERYGHRRDGSTVQVVRALLTVIGRIDAPPPPKLPPAAEAPAPRAWRDVTFSSGETLATPIYSAVALGAGSTLTGPAVVEAPTTTTLLPPGAWAICDDKGTLIIDLAGGTTDG